MHMIEIPNCVPEYNREMENEMDSKQTKKEVKTYIGDDGWEYEIKEEVKNETVSL